MVSNLLVLALQAAAFLIVVSFTHVGARPPPGLGSALPPLSSDSASWSGKLGTGSPVKGRFLLGYVREELRQPVYKVNQFTTAEEAVQGITVGSQGQLAFWSGEDSM
ncbi:UNVERIFIED_CONTAM: hypothetical protein FKN15_035950 [Acipenser sinensis]